MGITGVNKKKEQREREWDGAEDGAGEWKKLWDMTVGMGHRIHGATQFYRDPYSNILFFYTMSESVLFSFLTDRQTKSNNQSVNFCVRQKSMKINKI